MGGVANSKISSMGGVANSKFSSMGGVANSKFSSVGGVAKRESKNVILLGYRRCPKKNIGHIKRIYTDTS